MDKKTMGKSIKNYLTRALNGMALGLFSSLIIGLILKQIGEQANLSILVNFGQRAQFLMGPAIGVGVAYAIGTPPLGIFASAITGAIGANTILLTEGGLYSIQTGEPVGALVAALIGAEIAKLLAGRTRVDIVLIPGLTIVSGGLAGYLLAPPIAIFMKGLGQLINTFTTIHPIPMGIFISVFMGIILTLPISSAAIAMSWGLDGLAAGAAVVGGASHMIGFAVASYRENGFGGLVAQGIGTSMLQVANIIKNPLILIPPTITSAILGPVATYVFAMESNSVGAGMGTSGFVGQFGTMAKMVVENDDIASLVCIKIFLLHFLLPAIITLAIAAYMRRKNWIKAGDMKLME